MENNTTKIKQNVLIFTERFGFSFWEEIESADIFIQPVHPFVTAELSEFKVAVQKYLAGQLWI